MPPSPAPAGRKHHPWQHLPWNAQFQQDRKLVQFVFRNRQRGFYIELGARDGKEHSNTYALEMAQGWSGILIDIFQNEECKKNRPHSTCIQACAAREVPWLHWFLLIPDPKLSDADWWETFGTAPNKLAPSFEPELSLVFLSLSLFLLW